VYPWRKLVELKEEQEEREWYGKRYGLELSLLCEVADGRRGTDFLAEQGGRPARVSLCWVKRIRSGERLSADPECIQGSGQKLPGPVREKIVEIKKREPLFGVKRISHLLKRAFSSAQPGDSEADAEEESLIVPSKKKPRHTSVVPGFSNVRGRISYGRRTSSRSVWGPECVFDWVYP